MTESIFSEIAGWTTIFAKGGQELIASGFIKTINKIFNFIAGNAQIKIPRLIAVLIFKILKKQAPTHLATIPVCP